MSSCWSICTIDFDSYIKSPPWSHSSETTTEAFQGEKLSLFLQHNSSVIVKFVKPMPPPLSAFVDSVWCFHDNFGTPCLSVLNACLLPSLGGAAYLANHLSHVYLSVSEKQKQKVPSAKCICILDTSIWHTHVGFPNSIVWRSSLWALSLVSSLGLLFRDYPPEAKKFPVGKKKDHSNKHNRTPWFPNIHNE